MKKNIIILLACIFFLAQCSKKDLVDASPAALNDKSVGASANDFLSAAKYTSINIQLQYMPGFAPDAVALDNIIAFLNTHVNKPGGVRISQSQIAGSGKTTLTISDLVEIEKANRTQFNSGSVLSVYLLFADARYTPANTVGVAYKNTSLVIFGPAVAANSGGINQTTRTRLETIVGHHEFGHLFGLTNLGSPMVTPHEDGSNKGHCDNNACLMYYLTQTSVMGGILMSGPFPALDENCKADLRANGGK